MDNKPVPSSPCPSQISESRKKKGPQPKIQQGEKCVICGANASGFHYNVLTCEGCKGFFRRSIVKKRKYPCKMDKSCELEPENNRKCQHCRFKKCLEKGMTNQMVGLYKNRSNINQKLQNDIQRQHQEDHNDLAEFYHVKNAEINNLCPVIVPRKPPVQKKKVDPLVAQLIRQVEKSRKDGRFLKILDTLADGYIRTEIPDNQTQNQINRNNYSDQNNQKQSSSIDEKLDSNMFKKQFQHFVDLTIGALKAYALFLSTVDDIMDLNIDLRKRLIKQTIMGGMVLKACYDYNMEDDTVNFLNGSRRGRGDYLNLFPPELINELFETMKLIKKYLPNKKVLVLVTLIISFNPCNACTSNDKETVTRLRLKYSQYLIKYCLSIDKPFLPVDIMLYLNKVFDVERNVLNYIQLLCQTRFKTDFPVLDDLYHKWLQGEQ